MAMKNNNIGHLKDMLAMAAALATLALILTLEASN